MRPVPHPAACARVLIQHNPNEGLKLPVPYPCPNPAPVLIQHNPNEGLKREH